MKLTDRWQLLPLVAMLVFCPQVGAQGFSSGSTGADGALNVTGSDLTVELPPDGILNYTTITVSSGRTLRFTPNALNTPVYLLATGDVTIAGLVSLDGGRGNNVSGGLPGPGGFAGGNPASAGTEPGDGHGPGGGRAGLNTTDTDGAGAGSYATVASAGGSTRNGATYGSAVLVPIVGGSGGGGTVGSPGFGGGGGGGAIQIASSTRIHVTGAIRARGGAGNGSAYNFGSGGAIRLVAPVVSGSGTLSVRSAEGFFDAHGRSRVDTQNRAQLNFGFDPPATASVGSLMLVFPAPLPRLDVVSAAGTAIPVGSGPVFVSLPFNSPSSQVVTVQARDFGRTVPVRVVLVPDHGPASTYDAQIDNQAANPASVNVTVEFPLNVQTAVEVWTR